jgi:Phage tail protein
VAFPTYGLTVPTLTSLQFSFRGLTFGPGTILELETIEGLDLPKVRSGDSERSRDHGTYVGLDLLGGREIVTKGDTKASSSVSFTEACEQVEAATEPGGTTLYPLYVNLPGWGTLATLARVRGRAMPWNLRRTLGNLAETTISFAAPDPRMYGETQQVTITARSVSGGYTFPITFPLSFGSSASAGAATVTNNGTFETRPLLVVTGPCENPSIGNATLEGAPSLTFGSGSTPLVMNTGDQLVIDTDFHTATLYTAGNNIGSSRLYLLTAGSEWWTLLPGENLVQFASGTGQGTLAVQYASAWSL